MFPIMNRIWLLLTTQLHLATLFVPPECTESHFDIYPPVIIVSTVASSLWHLTGEQVPWITSLDMTFALVWFLLDMTYAYAFHTWMVFVQVLYLNCAVGIIHITLETYKQKDPHAYIVNHSLWHLLSAAKCLAVASLLHCQ
jgi:hypothetical protein